MDERRLKGILGLSVRAGQAVFGEDGCRKALQNNAGGVLLLDAEASANTRKRYEELCGRTGHRMALLPAGFLETATGRPGAAMYVKEGSFSTQVIGCLDTDNKR